MVSNGDKERACAWIYAGMGYNFSNLSNDYNGYAWNYKGADFGVYSGWIRLCHYGRFSPGINAEINGYEKATFLYPAYISNVHGIRTNGYGLLPQ